MTGSRIWAGVKSDVVGGCDAVDFVLALPCAPTALETCTAAQDLARRLPVVTAMMPARLYQAESTFPSAGRSLV